MFNRPIFDIPGAQRITSGVYGLRGRASGAANAAGKVWDAAKVFDEKTAGRSVGGMMHTARGKGWERGIGLFDPSMTGRNKAIMGGTAALGLGAMAWHHHHARSQQYQSWQ